MKYIDKTTEVTLWIMTILDKSSTLLKMWGRINIQLCGPFSFLTTSSIKKTDDLLRDKDPFRQIVRILSKE